MKKEGKLGRMFVEERFTVHEPVILIGISEYAHTRILKKEINKAKENGPPIHVGGTIKLSYRDAEPILKKLRRYEEEGRIVIANEEYIAAVSQLYPLKKELKELNWQRRQKGLLHKEKKNLQTAVRSARRSFSDARDSLLEGKHPVEWMSEYMN